MRDRLFESTTALIVIVGSLCVIGHAVLIAGLMEHIR